MKARLIACDCLPPMQELLRFACPVCGTHHGETVQVSGPVKPRGINVNAVPSKGTFRSSISLSEGAPATVQSTYGQVHGASMPQLMQAVQTVAQQNAEVNY